MQLSGVLGSGYDYAAIKVSASISSEARGPLPSARGFSRTISVASPD